VATVLGGGTGCLLIQARALQSIATAACREAPTTSLPFPRNPLLGRANTKIRAALRQVAQTAVQAAPSTCCPGSRNRWGTDHPEPGAAAGDARIAPVAVRGPAVDGGSVVTAASKDPAKAACDKRIGNRSHWVVRT